MADPSTSAGDNDFPQEDEGGGESTVSMTSPTIDPAVPLPISVPPPAMPGGRAPGGGPMQMQMPTAPVPFTPGGGPAAMPVQGRPQTPATSMPTPFGGITPGPPPSQPKPLPAAGAPPIAASPVPGASAGGTGPGGLKRPQTVIGLAPPPIGAPRPGSPGAGRVPLPSGRTPAAAAGGAPRAPVAGAGADKPPPSSSRGVKPPALPSTPVGKDADSTDEQLAMPDDTPDSQKEEMPTMAKSAEESLALFGLGSGLTDAARAAVVPMPAGGRPGTPPAGAVQPISPLGPDQQTAALRMQPPAAGMPAGGDTPLPVLHDRSEEEESTRAVSREEMLRGHDAVIIGEDGESAQGEDATLAVMPGMNDANSKHLAALADSLTNNQQPGGQPDPQGGFPPPYGQQQQPPQQPWGQQDPNAYPQQQPQQPWGQQDPNAYQQQPQGQWNGPQGYPMSPGGAVGPVSGPHIPAAYPQSQPHLQVPQSSPHMQAHPQSGHMQQQGYAQQQQQQAPIPYPGQPNIHQPPPNPFGDWNAGAPSQGKRKFVLSGQLLLLAIVGTISLAIFIIGIVLFATTKF